ncbi:MAG: hypothetical protein AAFZ11_04300, partial [Pseudomonadota bacterium]
MTIFRCENQICEASISNEKIKQSTSDPAQRSARENALKVMPDGFKMMADEALVFGHIFGPDRKEGKSPFGHGNDGAVAVGQLLAVASELLRGIATLLSQCNCYSASALSRQLVEIEYLIWTFQNEPDSAAQWMRSDKQERMKFFSPRAMRERSEGWFRKSDYANH